MTLVLFILGVFPIEYKNMRKLNKDDYHLVIIEVNEPKDGAKMCKCNFLKNYQNSEAKYYITF